MNRHIARGIQIQEKTKLDVLQAKQKAKEEPHEKKVVKEKKVKVLGTTGPLQKTKS